MAVYVRKRGEGGYFLGYAFPLQPLIGAAEYAFPFHSAEAAYAGTPAAIHAEMEVEGESVRRQDARHIYLWPVSPPPSDEEDQEGAAGSEAQAA